MSAYWRMWGKIKECTPEELAQFLEDHPIAEGKNLMFKGEEFFDVDLLEAVRNAHD